MGLLVAPQGPDQVAALVKEPDEGPFTDDESKYMKHLWLLATGRGTLA